MELTAFAHLKRRDVKVIRPGLVYVIEWKSGADLSPTTPDIPLSEQVPSPSSSPAPGDDREVRRTRRERKKEMKERAAKAKQMARISRNEDDSDEEDDASLGPVYVAYVYNIT